MTDNRPQRVAIVGSRGYTDPRRVVTYVLNLPHDVVIISGGAKGVDSWAETTAHMIGMKHLIHRPRVRPHTSYATVCKERNSRIVASADRVVAFWNHTSPGTCDTIKKAQAAGKELLIIDEDGGRRRSNTDTSLDSDLIVACPPNKHKVLDTSTDEDYAG